MKIKTKPTEEMTDKDYYDIVMSWENHISRAIRYVHSQIPGNKK